MGKKELKDFTKENLLDEKLFIVSGITVGKQMVNRMARLGNPSMNLKIVTLQGLAFEICQEYILNKGKLLMDSILASNLILDILRDLSSREGFFFSKNLIDAKTAEEVYRVILELKYSGVKDFPRTKNLDEIYGEYERRLKELNALDYPDIISLAKDLKALEEYKHKKIGVASNIEFYHIEKQLFEKLTEKNCTRIKMPVYSMGNEPKNYYYREEAKLSLENKKISFRGQYGSRNEINYIIEDIKRKRIKLDDVVIAYTNGKYADLINIEFEKNNIPISFGEGLSVKSSSTYRFVQEIFKWASSYYGVNEIRSIFISGDIKVDLKGGRTSSSQGLFYELLEFGIGFGRKNYLKGLGQSERREVVWLREFFKDLFKSIPEDGGKIKDYIPGLIRVVNKYVKNLNKYDGAAKIEILNTLKQLEGLSMEVSKEEYMDIILSYMDGTRILRSQPQPGQVFASNFRHGGYSGRGNLYLIGMDSTSLSNKVIESPILLDTKRMSISESLSSANEAYDYKKYKIRELLTADFKNISILYSNFDTMDVKAKSPSQIYIELEDEFGSVEETERRKYEIYGRDLVKSASALETLAECSRKAYLTYALGLRYEEEREILVQSWLSPLDKGNIVHNSLNIYFHRDGKENIEDIVRAQGESMREKVVCVLEDVYHREVVDIIQNCKNIIEATRRDKDWDILVNELSFGGTSMKKNKVFGALPGQKINIMGLDLDLRGAIDRVDVSRKDPKVFRIVDYKTGSKNNFDKKLRTKEGDYSQSKKLQYYIYKRALENILKDHKDIYENYEVSNFTYIFGEKANRNTIDLDFSQEFTDTIEMRIRELLEINILENDKNVVYDPENRELSCRYCEFSNICRSDKEVEVNGE